MVGEGIAPYQALPSEMKEAVDAYMENQEDFREVGNVELKPWQESLLEYVQQKPPIPLPLLDFPSSEINCLNRLLRGIDMIG